MTFTDQWANRHDGACEAAKAEAKAREIVKAGWNLTHNWMELPATANDLIREVSRALGCACYRRWLEERLEAVKNAGQKFADVDHVDEDGNVTPAYNAAYREWYGVLATLLPPKGAE